MSMGVLEWAIALYVAMGLMAFSAWCVRIWTTSQLPRWAEKKTEWIVFRTGAALVWLAAILLGGAVFGVAAAAAWRLIGGGT